MERRPLLVSALVSIGFLGFVQAAFLVGRNQAFMTPLFALGFTRLALILALATVLVLIPIVLLLRRRHPDWRRGDSPSATWSVAFGLVGALAAWMVADLLFAPPLVS